MTHRIRRGGDRWVGIDILRLDLNGKIAEHRVVLQRVPSSSRNDNKML